jgi:acetoin utilization deacetylase AcuC-like enzyme
MTTAYVTDSRYHTHTLAGHPEHAGRLQAIHALLDERGVTARMLRPTPEPVTDAQILSIHTPDYLEVLRWTETQQGVMLGSDTYVLPHSFGIARLAAGAAVSAVDTVMRGEADNALVAARPPGHHAVQDTAMGFCLLANISLAAMHARQQYDLERIMIVDIDVHHGNGTEAIFYDDPSVLFLSTHQYPWYPRTGAVTDTGRGAGVGYTINVPLEAGVGDIGFRQVYEQVVWPAARRYRPQLLLVSAGFDAHFADPLCTMRLTLPGYDFIVRELLRMADELCGGKIVLVLEGGYNLTSLSHGMLNLAKALLGDSDLSDPLGNAPGREPDVAPLLTRIRTLHRLG